MNASCNWQHFIARRSPNLLRKLKAIVSIATGGTVVFFGVCLCNGNEKFYKTVAMPLIRKLLDGETAHRFGVLTAKYGLYKPPIMKDSECLKVKLWNLTFPNPIGLAAGFDKNGEAITGLQKMGFGFIEIGSITPKPQPGNAKPRVFRLEEDEAVINRYGFNSDGHTAVYERLRHLPQRNGVGALIAINLGKNKTSRDADSDYVEGVRCFGHVGDFLVINVSSPNTRGLRDMQQKRALEKLLDAVIREKKDGKMNLPILVKIAPDLDDDEKRDIVHLLLLKGMDGIVVSNTTISRPASLRSPSKNEEGGLSGKPLKEMSTNAIRDIYKLSNGKLAIIGVGGVSCGGDAYEKIRAGASLVEIYTGLVYDGPPLVTKIKRELDELLKNDGFNSVAEAVGADHRKH